MIRVGIVGAGGMGERHARFLLQEPDVRVTAVVDRDHGRAEEFGRQFGARPYPAPDDAFYDQVDAVYVLTPPHRRVGIITAAVQAGRAVFCEKPLAATLEEGQAVLDAVEAAGTPFMVGFCFRFTEPMRRLKAVVDSGALGQPLSLARTRMGWLRHQRGNWRIDPAEITGMTVESVSHDLDMLRWLGGEITSVRGEVVGSDPALEGYDDGVAASLRFASGAIGSVQATWSCPVQHNSLTVVGTRGAAVLSGPGMWDWPALEVRTTDGASDVHRFTEAEATDMGWQAETQAFVEVLRGGNPVPVGVHDGMAVLRLSHQVLASSTADLHAWAGARTQP